MGICGFVLDQTVQKQDNKQKILDLLQGKGELSNSDIRAVLAVSRRSAVKYTTELEKEGKIEQVGDIGRGVVYRPQK